MSLVSFQTLEQKGHEVRAQLFGFQRPRSLLVLVDKGKGNPTVSKHATMQAQRCQYGDCKIPAYIYADFCDQHAKEVYKVEVKNSTIPNAGFGLFALDHFDEGDVIDLYEGKRLPKNQFTQKLNLPYGFLVDEHKCIVDAASSQSCVSRYINHHTSLANCGFRRFQPEPSITLIAVQTLHPVPKGDELFVNYGSQYNNCFLLSS